MRPTEIKRFKTEDGIIVPAITSEQMREVDRIAMEETGPNLFQMMENAGRNLALAALKYLAEQWRDAHIVVLAGVGGNGGGGICAARHLANHNVKVSLCLAQPEALGEVPAYQQHIFRFTPGKEILLRELYHTKPDLILDAVIGYSLKGAPRGTALELIRWANDANTPILSLDVPSGVDATTGESPGECIHATQTITLALPKTGLQPEKTGELLLADIGIPESVYRQMGIDYHPPFGNKYVVRLLNQDNIKNGRKSG